MPDVVLALSDATLRAYTKDFDGLTFALTLWNDQKRTVRAEGVTLLEDIGTWECDALVRLPELDVPESGMG